MNALLFYLFIALVISFLCSLAEAILLSMPQSFLVTIKKTKNHGQPLFLNYKKNIDKPLSAILALNTVAHTIGAAGVGAQASKLFGDSSLGIVSPCPTYHPYSCFIRNYTQNNWSNLLENLSKHTYYLIRFMLILTYPLVVLSIKITQLFAKKKIKSLAGKS